MKAFVLITVFLLSSCIAGSGKPTFGYFRAIDTAYVLFVGSDTEWVNKDKFIVRKVVADTITRKIDTSYNHTQRDEHIDSIFLMVPNKNNNLYQ